MTFDTYRVNLFKRKIRAAIPNSEQIRLYFSVGKCHLVIPISMPYYGREQEAHDWITAGLKRHGIEYKVIRDRFGLWARSGHTGDELPIDSISIPIDQEALPERKRKVKNEASLSRDRLLNRNKSRAVHVQKALGNGSKKFEDIDCSKLSKRPMW